MRGRSDQSFLQRFINWFFVQVFTQERKAARPRREGSGNSLVGSSS